MQRGRWTVRSAPVPCALTPVMTPPTASRRAGIYGTRPEDAALFGYSRLARQDQSGFRIATKATVVIGFAATAAQFLATQATQPVLATIALLSTRSRLEAG